MKGNDKNIESSCLQYWHVNNSYRCVKSEKLLVNSLEWIEGTSQFKEDLIKNQNEEIYIRYSLEVGVQYLPRMTRNLSERVELGKAEMLVTNLHDKNERFRHIRNLKETLNHGLILTKCHRVIKFKQENWLEPYIKTNMDLSKIAKNNFDKVFFKLMNNAPFRNYGACKKVKRH